MDSNVRRSLATKLSVGILLMAVPLFVITLGVLFLQSRYLIRKEAQERAATILNTTLLSVRSSMSAVETATDANTWIFLEQFHPDSLLAFTRRIVFMNSHVHGCSFSAEPDVFPQCGRYYSVYTVRKGDTIMSERETPWEYFDQSWYSTARNAGHSCWIDPFDDTADTTLHSDDVIACYSKPLFNSEGTLLGIISSDMSMRRLADAVPVDDLPYPNAYFVLLGSDGTYFIHPDSTRLFNRTIFTDINPNRQSDMIALGHEMTSGKNGYMHVSVNGELCHVCYAPVPGTKWSLAFICPDKDVLKSYNRLTTIILVIIAVGLIIILFLSRHIVASTIHPLKTLLGKLQKIASGNFDHPIQHTPRKDVIGLLQNSFATMQQSINFHISGIRHTTEEMRKRNEELVHVTQLAEEAVRQKTTFIQNVTHQIRTPLNIIMGFAQVLRDAVNVSASSPGSKSMLAADEISSIGETMKYNSNHLERMVLMLYDSSDIGAVEELLAQRTDNVPCNDIAREAIDYMQSHFFDKTVTFRSELSDDYCILTSRLYLMRTIRELLYNAAKYSDGKHISIIISKTAGKILYIIEDEGAGITGQSPDMLFKPFAKADDLSEGLGLGLPLAKRHAVSLGGDLRLDTSYRGGCRFIVEVPSGEK